MPREPSNPFAFFDAVRELARVLPDVEQSSGPGAPSLKVRGKLLTCPALHKSAEPNSLVVKIGIDQRAELIAGDPDVYYVTDHYLNYPSVLVRMSNIDHESLKGLLFSACRFVIGAKKTKNRGVRKSATARRTLR
jgi:hypothetical protein